MSKSSKSESPIKVEKPTSEDEEMKEKVLKLWQEDRMTLLSWRPFIGILAMHLDLVPVVDHRCQTACTDGRRIFFNPYFIDKLSPDERITILAHEIWHCGLLHFSREIGRIEQHKPWNYAIDHEVNALLRQDGFKLPSGAVLYREHIGKSAEQIFELISSGELPIEGMLVDEHFVGQPDCDDQGIGNPNEEESCGCSSGPLVEVDGDNITVKIDSSFLPRRSDDVWKEWRANMKGAAQRCASRGVEIGNYSWAIKDILEPRIHWKELLRQFITPVLGNARQWLPPNRRFVTQGLYLPSRKKDHELKIVIVIDTSGSTFGPIVQDFISEVNSIMQSFGAFELTVLQADTRVRAVDVFTHEENFNPEDFELVGGGGTDFIPAFTWVDENLDLPPKAFLYMTDGYGPAPSEAPQYPVLWVLNETGIMPCDWGQMIRIEDYSHE